MQYGLIEEIAWFEDNSEGTTHDVGLKDPNAFGLFDMLGNVWEWCWDLYSSYPTTMKTNYRGSSYGTYRIIRGGSFNFMKHDLRVGDRFSTITHGEGYLSFGFRIARSL